MPMERTSGIETEYGIAGGNARDVVKAHRCKAGHYNAGPTNNSILSENDRGHRGGDYQTTERRLHTGNFFGLDIEVTLSDEERDYERGGMDESGARFYEDMGHPEWATPECRTARDVVLYDKAGERAVNRASKRSKNGHKISIYKNNADRKGNSYGTHENHLIERLEPIDFETVFIPGITPHLVTRQIYTGSGKVGVDDEFDECLIKRRYREVMKNFIRKHGVQKYRTLGLKIDRYFDHTERRKRSRIYQLSQRADFISVPFGIQTTYMRPIVNTRDEPHTDPDKYMRLHLILGDANMAEIANYLKIGVTRLVLDLIEDDLAPKIVIEDPVQAFKHISRDQSYKWLVKASRTSGTGTISAIDIQRLYLEAAQTYRGRDEETNDLLAKWEYTLDTLADDPMKLSRWIDWVAKKKLLLHLMDRHDIGWDHDIILNAAMQYHDIDPETSIFYAIQDGEEIDRLVTDEEIEHAVDHPPEDTRAWLRGNLIRLYEVEADWGELKVNLGGRTIRIELPEPFFGTREQFEDIVESPEQLIKRFVV